MFECHCWSTVEIYCEWPNICCEDNIPPPYGNGVCDNPPREWILSCASCETIDCNEPPCDDWQGAPPECYWDGLNCEQLGQITCEDGSCADTIEDCPASWDEVGELIGYVYRRTDNPYQFKGPYPQCDSTRWEDFMNDDDYHFQTSWYWHGYSDDTLWNEYDEEMPELTCAAVFGLYCGNHDDPPYNGNSPHGTNPIIWPDWWSRSSDPNDYIAVECSSTEDGIYYQCHERLEVPDYGDVIGAVVPECIRCQTARACREQFAGSQRYFCNYNAEGATDSYGCCEEMGIGVPRTTSKGNEKERLIKEILRRQRNG